MAEATIQQHVFSLVKACMISVSRIETEEGSTYCPTVHFVISQSSDSEETLELPLMTEVVTETLSSAVYTAYKIAGAFTDNFYDDIHLFDLDGESNETYSLQEIVNEIKLMIAAVIEEETGSEDKFVPAGTTIH